MGTNHTTTTPKVCPAVQAVLENPLEPLANIRNSNAPSEGAYLIDALNALEMASTLTLALVDLLAVDTPAHRIAWAVHLNTTRSADALGEALGVEVVQL